MDRHPSLDKEFIGPERIRAVPTMEPYKPCWCRSGKNYKFCHYRRDKLEPLNVFELEKDMLKRFQDGYCSFLGVNDSQCSKGITQAHTVQRKGGLSLIAESGHVLGLKPTMALLIKNDGNPKPRRIGLKQASVFPGFCNKHDTALFKVIEQPNIASTDETALLFAYRAIAYERFQKAAQLNCMGLYRKMDSGKPLHIQELIQDHLNATAIGVEMGLDDVNSLKEQYDESLLSKNYDDLHWVIIKFNQLLPLVGCGAFFPEYDFQGNSLQKLGRRVHTLEHLAVNIAAYDNSSYLIFSWIGKPNVATAQFVKSFLEIETDRKADGVVRMCFELLENIFLRESWFDGLDEFHHKNLLGRIWNGLASQPRSSNCLTDDRTNFFTDHEVQETVISNELREYLQS